MYTYIPTYIKESLFSSLNKEIPWKQGKVEVYGKEHSIPRLQCFMGDIGIQYTYSNKRLHAVNWTPIVEMLKNKLLSDFSLDFNNVLCNYYRDGKDKIGWHFDDETELAKYPIASLSFGIS